MKNDIDYNESNKICCIQRKRFALSYGSMILNCGEDYQERLYYSQKLINYLCDVFNIRALNVVVHNTRRRLKKHGEIYGYYDYKSIHIYNKTGRKGNVVSIKSYFDTLLHEFMHHYDLCYLGLPKTLHTSGFYRRINDLKEKITKGGL